MVSFKNMEGWLLQTKKDQNDKFQILCQKPEKSEIVPTNIYKFGLTLKM